ncbi:MIF4G/MA4-domain-containing protein [Mycena kentingensis (nom. inval.)]|nr:MIF4G/MA4-domain-containing protein [Mycena kentingensis (nom. inval.)]
MPVFSDVPPHRLPPLKTSWPTYSDAGMPSPKSTRSSPRRDTQTHPHHFFICDCSNSQPSPREARALFNTCRDTRDFLCCPELKTEILSRFIGPYNACLRNSDSARLQDVPVTFADLNCLMISSAVILHRYPMFSLQYLSKLLPDVDRAEREETSRLVALTQAHSRFVLVLQALAHSSSLPPPQGRDDIDWRSRPRSADYKFRQLNFPAPLSFAPAAAPAVARGRKSVESVSTDRTRSLSRPGSRSRLSIFGGSGSKVPLPPASEPRSLKHYSSSWRQAFLRMSSSASDDEWSSKPLERPPPEIRVEQPLYRFFVIFRQSFSSLFAKLDHGVWLADSAVHVLDERSIGLCEDQLCDSGLWNHLSTGDVICNLGFVPPPSPDEPGSSDGGLADSAGSEPAVQHRRQWLLFNGDSLVPFVSSLPASMNPFILPSPFYYVHIAPHSNPVFTVRCFPACDDIPQFTLVSSSVKVRSPHSPAGVAFVKQYRWTARVWRQVAMDDEIGLGWQGEWVLEGDGTLEGQSALIDCLRGVKGPYREWELVREKSRGATLYFRLLRTFMPKRRRSQMPDIELDSP